MIEAARLTSLNQMEQETWKQSWSKGEPPEHDLVTGPTCPHQSIETSVQHPESSEMWPSQVRRISLAVGPVRITCLRLRREPPDHKVHVEKSPLTAFPGGLRRLHEAGPDAVEWLSYFLVLCDTLQNRLVSPVGLRPTAYRACR